MGNLRDLSRDSRVIDTNVKRFKAIEREKTLFELHQPAKTIPWKDRLGDTVARHSSVCPNWEIEIYLRTAHSFARAEDLLLTLWNQVVCVVLLLGGMSTSLCWNFTSFFIQVIVGWLAEITWEGYGHNNSITNKRNIMYVHEAKQQSAIARVLRGWYNKRATDQTQLRKWSVQLTPNPSIK